MEWDWNYITTKHLRVSVVEYEKEVREAINFVK
jgi:hypothetical protein